MKDINLDLDVQRRTRNGASDRVARICVVLACGYVKDGGAPTITEDCGSYEELQREVKRLKDELDSILGRAEAEFGRRPEAAARRSDLEKPPGAAAEPAAQRKKPRVGRDLCVSDVMTRDVKTLERNDKLSIADELMKVGRFRHVVVLDEHEEVAGVVSQRDIFYGALAWSMGQGQVAHQKTLESFLVKAIMQSNVVTVRPDTPLTTAAETMMERKIGCLPVVDGRRLVGILTEGDFLAMLASSYQ